MANMRFMPLKRRQSGVGLMEILVTMLVMSVGLLGIAGLQSESLRHTYNAYLESQALFLAEDIIDRMRLSPTPSLYAYDFSGGVVAATDCTAVSCDTPETMSNWDLSDWISQVESVLPSGEAAIKPLNDALGEYEITIRYDDIRGGNRDTGNDQAQRELRIVTRI